MYQKKKKTPQHSIPFKKHIKAVNKQANKQQHTLCTRKDTTWGVPGHLGLKAVMPRH